jgi:hypothetical protein
MISVHLGGKLNAKKWFDKDSLMNTIYYFGNHFTIKLQSKLTIKCNSHP